MALEAEGIPSSFEFNGCVIVLTNTNLEKARAAKQGHYDAIISRAHYINAVLETEREKVLRIMHVIENSNILNKFLEKTSHKDVIDFIREHAHNARELSIRTVVKLAELRAAFPEDWLVLAKGTLLK
jgi:hypothetical protein